MVFDWDALQTHCREAIAPVAATLDHDPVALDQALQGLGDRNLLTLRLPTEWGGQGLSDAEFWQFQATLARYSGALTFLQTQHQSAAGFIYNGDNEALKQTYLPAMATGAKRVGIAYSHLRRPGAPLLKALPIPGGYQLHGTIPWATGFGLFHDLMVGATLPDGQFVLGVLPWDTQLTPSEPMALVAASSTQTVSLTLQDVFLPDDQTIARKPADWLPQLDRANLLKPTAMMLGCATASLALLPPHAATLQQTLQIELQHLQTQILDALTGPLRERGWEARCAGLPPSFSENATPPLSLSWRAQALQLCHRCVQGAIVASAGAANLQNHPAGRLYREALLWSVTGQTATVQAANLAVLGASPLP